MLNRINLVFPQGALAWLSSRPTGRGCAQGRLCGALASRSFPGGTSGGRRGVCREQGFHRFAMAFGDGGGSRSRLSARLWDETEGPRSGALSLDLPTARPEKESHPGPVLEEMEPGIEESRPSCGKNAADPTPAASSPSPCQVASCLLAGPALSTARAEVKPPLSW